MADHFTTTANCAARRALLFAYHFGEDAGTGAFRWNTMVPNLAALGWSFDVITLRRPGAEATSQGETMPRDAAIRVFALRQPRWLEASVGRILSLGRRARRWVSGGSAAPAPASVANTSNGWSGPSRKPSQRLTSILWSVVRSYGELRWTWRAFRLGRRLIRDRGHSVIIVSSPPHTAQLAGIFLSRRTAVPYLPDFRDPWARIMGKQSYLMHPIETILGRRYQPVSLREGRFVICNNDAAKRAAEETVQRNGAIVSIPNGYDALPTVRRPDRDRFRLVYAGALYPYHDVGALFAACRRFRDRSGIPAHEFRIEFMGMDPELGGVRVSRLADKFKLRDSFVLHAPAPREAALGLQQSAAVLVSFDHFHGKSCPMKFYDIVQMYAYPLLIGGTSGALAQQAAKIDLRVIEPTDAFRLDQALDAAYERWRSYHYDKPSDQTGIFDRRHQTRRMFELLERCVVDRTSTDTERINGHG